MKNIKFIAALAIAATVGMTTTAFAGYDSDDAYFCKNEAYAQCRQLSNKRLKKETLD